MSSAIKENQIMFRCKVWNIAMNYFELVYTCNNWQSVKKEAVISSTDTKMFMKR